MAMTATCGEAMACSAKYSRAADTSLSPSLRESTRAKACRLLSSPTSTVST